MGAARDKAVQICGCRLETSRCDKGLVGGEISVLSRLLPLGSVEVVRKRYPLSQPGLSIPIRGASRGGRRGRGGVFDLPMGVGRFHALPPTFGGYNFGYAVLEQSKAGAENGPDVAALFLPNTPSPSAFSAGVLLIRSRRPFAVAQLDFRMGSRFFGSDPRTILRTIPNCAYKGRLGLKKVALGQGIMQFWLHTTRSAIQ